MLWKGSGKFNFTSFPWKFGIISSMESFWWHNLGIFWLLFLEKIKNPSGCWKENWWYILQAEVTGDVQRPSKMWRERQSSLAHLGWLDTQKQLRQTPSTAILGSGMLWKFHSARSHGWSRCGGHSGWGHSDLFSGAAFPVVPLSKDVHSIFFSHLPKDTNNVKRTSRTLHKVARRWDAGVQSEEESWTEVYLNIPCVLWSLLLEAGGDLLWT